jgi:elongation factor G
MQMWLRLASRSFSFDLNRLRNIGISAHIDSGKTTFSERVLFYTGRIDAIHEVRGNDKVGAKMDSMELERERGITIQSAATFCKWKDTDINLIDTPGHVDFTIEVERALRVLDGAVLLICGSSGVQSQTLTVNRQMSRYNVPRIIFINKLDRAGANPDGVVQGIKERLKLKAHPIQMPIGLEDYHKGIIDVITRKAFYFEGSWGTDIQEREVPQELRAKVDATRATLIETLADVDETLCEKYLEGESISETDIKAAIRRATIALKFSPILMGSAYKNKGVQLALDAVTDYLPCPSEVSNFALDIDNEEAKVLMDTDPKKNLVCLAFKLEENRFGQLTYVRVYQGKLKRGDNITNTRTGKRVKVTRMVKMHSNEMVEIYEAVAGEIFALFGIECNSGDSFTDGNVNFAMTSMFIPEPVMSLAVRPIKKDSNIKFGKAIGRFMREDPTFRCKMDEESQQTVISGMGELHLQIYAERMKREYGVEVELGAPTVNYRETILQRSEFNYLHKKQTGGAGQFAGVQGYIEPLEDVPEGEFRPCEFVDGTSGMNIPPEFISAIEKGFSLCVAKGPQVGYPIVNMRYVIKDGQTHIVDSSTNAFIIATKGSFRQSFPEAKPQILEPVMNIEVIAPATFQNSVVGGLVRRRCFVKNSEIKADGSVLVLAEGPLSKMFGYSTDLRSSTQGQGEFSMEYLKMEPVDPGEAVELRESYVAKLRADKDKDSFDD